MTRYRGAAINRMNVFMGFGGESADSALLPELAMLRQRSRDMFRNNPMAAAIINALVKNVVGKGITPQSRIDWRSLGITKEAAKAIARRAELNFSEHCRSMDFSDRLTLRKQQRLIFRTTCESGEKLAIRRWVEPSERRWARYASCWQILEPDCLLTPADMMTSENIRAGVEFGDRGQPTHYWIAKRHPGDIEKLFSLKETAFQRIPAYDETGMPLVLHRYDHYRPGQSRGVPILSTIVDTLMKADQYLDVELAEGPLGDYGTQQTIGPDGTTSFDRAVKLEPASVLQLGPGETVQSHLPNRPNTALGPFLDYCQKIAGAVLNLPREIFTHDWSQTTYTSGRMSLLDFWDFADILRADEAEDFYQPTWEMSFYEQMQRGDLPPLRGFDRNRAAWTKAQWIPPARIWVDPEKDANSKVTAMENDMATLQNTADELSEDWEDLMEQRHEERMRRIEYQGREMLRQIELKLVPDPSQPTPAAQGEPANA
jgi:lambda family phage portal protein